MVCFLVAALLHAFQQPFLHAIQQLLLEYIDSATNARIVMVEIYVRKCYY